MAQHKPRLSPDDVDQTFTAGDLKRLIGLTYRQLNDWEKRAGALDSQREGNEGWRKFSAEHMLALAVCASLRRQFSLPLEKLGELRRWLMGAREDKHMERFAKEGELISKGFEEDFSELFDETGSFRIEALDDDFNRFIFQQHIQARLNIMRRWPIRYAYQSAKVFGETVYLYTDCEDTFMLYYEKNLSQLIALRALDRPILIVPLNKLFDGINKALGQSPIKQDKFGAPYSEELRALNEREEVTEDERKVLELIRDRSFTRVNLVTDKGKVLRAETEGEISDAELRKQAKQIVSAVSAGDFATVSVQQANGEVVRLVRKEKHKFAPATGKT
jgi:DNA-binding transcriptional MerR regulator